MIDVFLQAAGEVNELFIDASSFVVLLGGLLVTIAWFWALYRD
jgi:hypothetical protein